MLWNSGDLLGHFLLHSCQIVMEIDNWVLLPAKLPKIVAILAKNKGILEWLVEERQIKYQFQAQDQSQQQGV